jgi:hypothetical protein
MGDLSEIQSALAVKIIGSDTLGGETNPIKSSINQDLAVSDILDVGADNTILTIAVNTIYELKVGALARSARKYVVFQAIDPEIRWGFSPTSQPFYAYQAQLIMLPIGQNTSIYFRTQQAETEIQYLRFKLVPTTGTWKISINGSLTADIQWNATAAQIQAALVAANVSVTVTGDYTNGFLFTFTGTWANRDVPSVVTKTTNLYSGAYRVYTETLVQQEGAYACVLPRKISIGELS